MATGQNESVVFLDLEVGPGHRRPKFGRFGELLVVLLRLVLGPQLPEQHSGQQPWIGVGNGAGTLGREYHLVSGVGENPPGHRHLGDIEIAVGKRHQYAHDGIITGFLSVAASSNLPAEIALNAGLPPNALQHKAFLCPIFDIADTAQPLCASQVFDLGTAAVRSQHCDR